MSRRAERRDRGSLRLRRRAYSLWGMRVLISRIHLALVVSLVCGGFLILDSAVGVANQKPSATQLLQTAFSNARARRSVHENQLEIIKGKQGTFSDDVSIRSGRQTIDTPIGVRAHVLVVGSTAYISGNHKALVSYFGFPQAVAQRIGARWVKIPSSDSGYATVAADATLPSALSEITPSGQLTELSPRMLNGTAVIGIRGNLPSGFKGAGKDTIYLTRSAHPLPVSATFAGSGHLLTFTFRNWGEHVIANPPAISIPVSQL